MLLNRRWTFNPCVASEKQCRSWSDGFDNVSTVFSKKDKAVLSMRRVKCWYENIGLHIVVRNADFSWLWPAIYWFVLLLQELVYFQFHWQFSEKKSSKGILTASVCIPRHWLHFHWVLSPGIKLYVQSGNSDTHIWQFLSIPDWLKFRYLKWNHKANSSLINSQIKNSWNNHCAISSYLFPMQPVILHVGLVLSSV